MARVIFSIDNYYDLHSLAKFLRYMDTKRASGMLRGKFEILMGSWGGIPEVSFECEAQDFADYVIPFGCNKGQDSILVIFDQIDVFLVSGSRASERIGTWTEVSELEAKMAEGYTYKPEEEKWYLIK